MKKITVTREQQEVINTMRRNNFDFENMKATTLNGQWVRSIQSDALNGMTDEQFSAAWFCAADVEPEAVEPWQAYKAYYDGKTIKAVYNDGAIWKVYKSFKEFPSNLFYPHAIERHGTKFYILEEDTPDA